jgi:hypothetical protein
MVRVGEPKALGDARYEWLEWYEILTRGMVRFSFSAEGTILVVGRDVLDCCLRLLNDNLFLVTTELAFCSYISIDNASWRILSGEKYHFLLQRNALLYVPFC